MSESGSKTGHAFTKHTFLIVLVRVPPWCFVWRDFLLCQYSRHCSRSDQPFWVELANWLLRRACCTIAGHVKRGDWRSWWNSVKIYTNAKYMNAQKYCGCQKSEMNKLPESMTCNMHAVREKVIITIKKVTREKKVHVCIVRKGNTQSLNKAQTSIPV